MSKQYYMSIALGVAIAIALLLFTSQIYSRLSPQYRIEKAEDYGSPATSPAPLANRLQSTNLPAGEEYATLLLYIKYSPKVMNAPDIEVEVNRVIVTINNVVVEVPDTTILNRSYILEPGGKALIVATPIPTGTLTKVSLTITIHPIQSNINETETLEWIGSINLETLTPTQITIIINK